MRRITHLLLGAAVTVPIAIDHPVVMAAGCLVVGVIGGGTPDWLDFRTGLRRPFVPRHRGVSHGLPLLMGTLSVPVATWVMMRNWGGEPPRILESMEGLQGLLLLTAFGLGWLSHLGADACTNAGLQPFLPFSRRRCWLLPRRMRSRYDGYLDKLVRLGALVILGFGLVVYGQQWWPA